MTEAYTATERRENDLTEQEKQGICADYATSGSYAAVARLYGISAKAVRRIVLEQDGENRTDKLSEGAKRAKTRSVGAATERSPANAAQGAASGDNEQQTLPEAFAPKEDAEKGEALEEVVQGDAAAGSTAGSTANGLQGDAAEHSPEGTPEQAAKLGSHIARRREDMCAIFDLLLDALRDEDKIAKAPINQIASTLRVFMKELDEDEEDEDGAGQLSQILKAVRGIA